jgi:hypothetical protein
MISDLVTDSYMNGLAQYGVRRGRMETPIIIDDLNPPQTIVYTDSNNNLVDEITHKIIEWNNAGLVPPPPGNNLNQMYLITPPSETTPEMWNGPKDPIGKGVQGWHNKGSSNPAPPPTYYWGIVKTNDCGLPSAGLTFVNNFAAKVAHELAEQFVDRIGAIVEVGDNCLNNVEYYRGWTIQQHWSALDNGCISSD